MYDFIVLIIVFIDKVLNIPRGNKKMMNIQKSHREQHNNEYSSYISFFFLNTASLIQITIQYCTNCLCETYNKYPYIHVVN